MHALLVSARDERAIAAPMFGIVLTAMLGVSAMSVDMGSNWHQRAQLSGAVDSAALAAANAYAQGQDGCAAIAELYLTRNRDDANLLSCVPNGDTVNGTEGWVTVTAELSADQFFGRVIGVDTVEISVSGSALWGIPEVEVEEARPFGICYETLAADPDFQDWLANGGDSVPIEIPYNKDNVNDCTGPDEDECIAADIVQEVVNSSGDAYYDSGNGAFILTPDQYYQAGTVMSNERIDIRYDFSIVFDIYLGTTDSWGADGMGFVFHNDPAGANALGGYGGGLGMSGIENSVGIEFDSWWNGEYFPHNGQQAGDDPTADHTAIYDPEQIIEDTSYSPSHPVLYDGDQRLTPLVTLPNIENGQWHTAEVYWNSSVEVLSYSFDGFNVDNLEIDLANDHFNSDFAYFGFSASTGAAKNLHMLRFEEFQAVMEGDDPDCEDTPSGEGVPGNWGIIDFDGGSNSNADTKDWIENGYDGLTDAGWFEGDPGAMGGSYKNAMQALEDSGEVFAVPLFTYATEQGANTEFLVESFAQVQLHDFKVNGKKKKRHVTLIFKSEVVEDTCCEEIDPADPPIDVNLRATRTCQLGEDGRPIRRG